MISSQSLTYPGLHSSNARISIISTNVEIPTVEADNSEIGLGREQHKQENIKGEKERQLQ